MNTSRPRWEAVRLALTAASADRMLLQNARLPAAAVDNPFLPEAGDGLVAANLRIENGRLSLLPPGIVADDDGIDLAGAMVWPGTIDCHTHIDKGQTWPRVAGGDGTFDYALNHAGPAVHAYGSEADQRRRSNFMLRAAWAHGCVALRSHVDGYRENYDYRYGILAELAQDWSNHIAIQLCPFTGIGEDREWVAQLARRASDAPGRTFSVVLTGNSFIDEFIDQIFELAQRFDLGLDFHADENLDPASQHLDAIARGALRHRFQGPVLVGHCCSLSVQDEETVKRTLDRVAEAGLDVVALPHSNCYLQDRHPERSPRQRGMAPLKEMAAQDIRVAIASDNSRDAFNAYGDMDLPELFRDAIRFMQLDHPVANWPALVLGNPAAMLGQPLLGRIHDDAPADLILFPARNWSEFAARPVTQRIVLRGGRIIDSTPPDFAELDSLEGMLP